MSKAARSRWRSPALYAGILVAFLLPFATVSCGQEEVTFSGAELALMQVPEDSGEDSLAAEIEAESSLPALAALAAALAGLLLGVAGRRGGGIAAAAGSLAMLALVSDCAASLATVEVHVGFVLALLGFAIAATHHALAARRRRAAVSDGGAPAAARGGRGP